MMRFGTLFAVAALGGVMLSGCDADLWSRDAPVDSADARCPTQPKPACPPAAEEVQKAEAETAAAQKVVRTRKAARRAVSHRRVHVTRQEDHDAGLAGGRVYKRYHGGQAESRDVYRRYEGGAERDYAYRRHDVRPPARAYAYSREESSSESASMRAYEESSGYAEGGGYAYAHGYGGGFDPRRERYYAAGRDSQGYLVWPGKRD